jgi:hypothetical protein
MSSHLKRPDTTRILRELKDFQRETVAYVYRRLYEDDDAISRFLIADEVGLGKTLVARGVIAKAVDELWDSADRIDIVYVCANWDIARQNINRLNITGEPDVAVATRMTLLPLYLHKLQDRKLNFVSFTPKTSFDLRSQGGIAYERALIYHILRRGWGFGSMAGPRNLLQCDVGKDRWHSHLANFNTDDIDQELEKKYLDALERQLDVRARFDDLIQRFSHYRKRKNIPWQDNRDRLVLIGNLRRILAESCVNALEPDIVILDEFQRFKYLLDGDDEVALLAQALFNYPKVKVLLLSATPYKMYTMYHESQDDDHYCDFIRTARFLCDSDEETEALRADLSRYRKALFRIGIGSDGAGDLLQAKEAVETKLRQVMVRTERLSVTAGRDAMIESRESLGRLTTQELHSFVLVDNVARTLGVRDTVEYWKSAPYLLNLMDRQGYKIKQEFVNCVEKHKHLDELMTTLKSGKENLLSWDTIRTYRRIDPGNAKLRTLIEHTVERGAWQILWIPPSLPYYATANTPFADPALMNFTKALVFSSWQVVPKVIATLCSYEAERRMVSVSDTTADYPEERRKRRPLLRFAISRTASSEGRYTGMSNFTLLYPCLTLASRIDPLEVCLSLASGNTLPDVHQVMNTLSDYIERLISPVLAKYARSDGRADERWYWAALALLDQHHNTRSVRRWLLSGAEDIAWREMIQRRGEDDTDSHFAEHVNLFRERFEGKSKLGKPPDDLVDVLTKIALASPAVVALRSLLRFYPPAEPERPIGRSLAAAANIALGFRSLFNMPDSITLLRGLQPADDTRYWESVLEYCVNGNLQSVMDEYVHILRESLGLIDTPAEAAVKYLADEIQTAVSIRTVNLNFDEIKLRAIPKKIDLDPHSLRCRFALRFGEGRDEEGAETRADQVRCAFNSPFRPFILATTSIGQEGLDFHQYCHAIYHWNLPSNPVDLEQREGRIHRYKGHVIRRNVAKAFPLPSLCGRVPQLVDPWQTLFSLASDISRPNDLIPFWIFEVEDGHKVYRYIPVLPLSSEQGRLGDLCRTLVAYRMVFGQSRQPDMVSYLKSRSGSDLDLEELLKYRIDLSPKL